MILAVIAVVASLSLARAFFVPLLIGILLSYSLRPLVNGLHHLRIPLPVGAALVVGGLLAGGSWLAYTLSDDAAVMVEKLPDAARRLRKRLQSGNTDAPTALQNVEETARELQRVASDAAEGAAAAAAAPSWALRDYVIAQSTLLISTLAQTPIVMMIAYFLLASGAHFRQKLSGLLGPSLSQEKDTASLLNEIDTQVQRYLFVTLAANVLVAVGTFIVFKILGMPHAGVWAVAAGVLHTVPYLGATTVAVSAGIAGFVETGTWEHALMLVGSVVLVEVLIGMIFATWLQGRAAHVNPAVLFIALLFFDWLWGVAGLLLGAPLLAVMKVICDRIDSLHPIGNLLGD
ncbi:MAG: AI-2E family transporter [Vicinamibacteria bacterium]